MKGFSLKGENVKPEKWNPSKVSEILKTDGFWQVLYHQLATEETEEAEEKRRKVFRPRLNRNSIMELSIHNRFLLIRKLSICDSFWNQTAVLHLPGCDRGLWHLSSYSHNSLGDQYQGGTKDRIPTQKKWLTSTFQGGVTYVENMGIPFNWHPILMTISLIFLYGNGQSLINIFISPCNYLDPPQEPSSTGSSPQRARGTNWSWRSPTPASWLLPLPSWSLDSRFIAINKQCNWLSREIEINHVLNVSRQLSTVTTSLSHRSPTCTHCTGDSKSGQNVSFQCL